MPARVELRLLAPACRARDGERELAAAAARCASISVARFFRGSSVATVSTYGRPSARGRRA